MFKGVEFHPKGVQVKNEIGYACFGCIMGTVIPAGIQRTCNICILYSPRVLCGDMHNSASLACIVGTK